MEFFATCSHGAEAVLGAELRAAGVHGVRPLKAGVAFHGDVCDAYRALLWSRTAVRVLLTLGRVRSRNADELYRDVFELPWEEHVALGRTIAVDARGVNDALRNTQFTALRVKDAICDALLARRGSRPNVDTQHPDVQVNVVLGRDKATISIDLSGKPLDRRGYLLAAKPPVASLRETIAAAALLMAGWGTADGAGVPVLYNPYAGTGSIAIEAALIARDIAPGILRSEWGFEGWAGYDEALWQGLLEEADARAEAGAANPVRIVAAEADPAAREYAAAKARRAGVADCIEWVEDAAAFGRTDAGFLTTGSPCGEPLREALVPAASAVRDDGTFLQEGVVAAQVGPQEKSGLPLQGEAVARKATEGVTRVAVASGPASPDQSVTAASSKDPAQNVPSSVIPSSARPKAEARREESLIGASRSDAPASAPNFMLAYLPVDAFSLASMPPLYAALSSQLQPLGVGSLALVTADAHADAFVGTPAAKSATANIAGSEYSIRVYDTAQATHAAAYEVTVRGHTVLAADAGAQQFASRLAKVAKQRRKWAKANNVGMYRVYDADLPDYNVAIDLYNGAGPDAGKQLVYVAEYAAPKEIEPEKAARRLAAALSVVPAVFDVDPSCVFVKQRLRAKGGSQYARHANAPESTTGQRMICAEGGLLFEVNLSDYLDTGIFCDHRTTRALLAALAKGKSFLNLFAYTGTASVYAAAGGAKFATTVDLSNTYLEWARRNFELNGLLNEHAEFERADCVAWVAEQRRTKHRWDLIFIDPPTFSNSAKMGRRSWDVQRDHAELLIGASRLLTRGGAIVFSCNLRSFKPDFEKLNKAGVQIADITPKTIPEDFARNPKIHKCYILRRG